MKKRLLPLMILFGSSFFAPQLISCKKSDSTATPVKSLAKGKSSVTANLTGAYSGTFTSNESMSLVAKSATIINIAAATSSALGGSGGLSEQFIILLPADITVGTYNTKDLPGLTFTYVGSNGASASGWTSGALETSIVFKITQATVDGIEGTFEGTMGDVDNNSTIAAKGTFAAKY